MIFYFIILLIIFFFYKNTLETFNIVAYNNTNVQDTTITSIYEHESNILQDLLNDLNLKNNNFKESKLDDEFKLINTNLIFPFSESFKSLLIEYLYTNIPKYKTDKVYILGKLIDIYQKNYSTSSTFIFNCTLVNPVNFFTRNIRIRLKLNNIHLILDKTHINEHLVKSNTILESITLDKNNFVNFTFTPIDKLNEPYYLIKNKYHLLDPFLTSGNDSIITNNHKLNFQSVLNKKMKSILPKYNPNIY